MPAQTSTVLDWFNQAGVIHWDFAVSMLQQTTLLFVVVGAVDLLVLRRWRTSLRCAVWSLMLVKLLLPPSLQGPLALTGLLSAPAIEAGAEMQPLRRKSPPVEMSRQITASPPAAVGQGGPADATRSTTASATQVALSREDTSQYLLSVLRQVNWKTWVMLAWATCVAFLGGLFIRRLMEVRSLVKSSRPASSRLQAALRDAQRTLGVPAASLAIHITDRLHSPAICGFWQPAILVPQTLERVLTPDQLRLVLVHEVIHWRRGDLYLNAAQSLLQIVYFYNPLVWASNLVLRRLREYGVDEETLIMSHSSAGNYAETLVNVAASSSLPRTVPRLALGVIESRSSLTQRVERMLSRPLPASSRLGWKGLLCTMLLGVVLLPLAGRKQILQAEDKPAAQASPEKAVTKSPAATELDLNTAAISAELRKALQTAEPHVAMLRTEEIAEEILSIGGEATKLLTAAGVTNVEKGELAGVVIDVNNKPVAGAKVDVWHWHPGNETTTNEQGVFRLKGFEEGDKLEVLISKPGFSPRLYLSRVTGRKDWAIILRNQTYVEGVVVGPDKVPVPGATVRAKCGPFELDGGVVDEIPFETTSAADGTFRLHLFPNIYDIEASATMRGVARHAKLKVAANQATNQPIELQAGIRFEALVVDSESGKPVEGFRLFRWSPPFLSAQSGPDGKLVLNELFPGTMEFNCGGGEKMDAGGVVYFGHGNFGRWWSPDAKHPHQKFFIDQTREGWQRNFDDLTFELAMGMDPVKIVVEQGVTVSGRVTDPDGKPVAKATIAPARTGSGNSLTGDTRYSVRTDENGLYRVVLPASNKSRYNLVAHDGDYNEWRKWANGVSEPFQTKPGQVIQNLDLKLTVPGVVRGRFTIAGKPAAGKSIRTHDFAKHENRYYDPTVKTAADGTFELKFVRPGKHYLQAEQFWLDAADGKISRIIEVKPGEVLEGMDLNTEREER